MIARGFKPVGWVAAVGGAAVCCYMLSLNVASERAELARVERQIVAAQVAIRSLQTELGTRGRMHQLERWNADVLALSAPNSAQYVDNAFTLARYDRTEPTIEQQAGQVRLASANTPPAQPPRREPEAQAPQPRLAVAPRLEAEERPVVRRASFVVTEERAAAPARRASLLDRDTLRELRAAADAEGAGDAGAE